VAIVTSIPLTSESAPNLSSKSLTSKHLSYGTERQVGLGVKRSGVPRRDIFVTTKLWCNAHHPDDVERALDASLGELDMDYVDLYLMHYPCAFRRGEELMPLAPDGRIIVEDIPFVETWKAMEKLISTGKTKAIGVSNFSKVELEQILAEGSVVSL
jgi:alcohol dehydrogenase (NADP+)